MKVFVPKFIWNLFVINLIYSFNLIVDYISMAFVKQIL